MGVTVERHRCTGERSYRLWRRTNVSSGKPWRFIPFSTILAIDSPDDHRFAQRRASGRGSDGVTVEIPTYPNKCNRVDWIRAKARFEPGSLVLRIKDAGKKGVFRSEEHTSELQ